MQNTELLDSIRPLSESVPHEIETRPPPEVLGFRDASFVWSNDRATDAQAFVLRVDGELLFKQGGINLVIGPTSVVLFLEFSGLFNVVLQWFRKNLTINGTSGRNALFTPATNILVCTSA